MNSWGRKTNVTTYLFFNVKVSDRDGAPLNSIWWSYLRLEVTNVPPISVVDIKT